MPNTLLQQILRARHNYCLLRSCIAYFVSLSLDPFFNKMKLPLTRVPACIFFISLSIPITAIGGAPEIIPPSRDEWNEIYDPPTKVPAEIPSGSELRRELFDSLRAKASPATQFSGSIKSFRNWAFFLGELLIVLAILSRTHPMVMMMRWRCGCGLKMAGSWSHTVSDTAMRSSSFGLGNTGSPSSFLV